MEDEKLTPLDIKLPLDRMLSYLAVDYLHTISMNFKLEINLANEGYSFSHKSQKFIEKNGTNTGKAFVFDPVKFLVAGRKKNWGTKFWHQLN